MIRTLKSTSAQLFARELSYLDHEIRTNSDGRDFAPSPRGEAGPGER